MGETPQISEKVRSRSRPDLSEVAWLQRHARRHVACSPHPPMQELRAETFEPRLASGIVIVECWAPWCDPCRAFLSVYEAASARHADVTFASVNAELQPGLAAALRISTIPTTLAFRDRILVYVHSGFMLAEALDTLVQKVRRLDMTIVRRKLAAFAV